MAADSSNNDFYVKFGSNAETWSQTLNDDLKGARQAIGFVNKLLNDLETNAGTRRKKVIDELAAMATEADRVQKKIEKISTAGKDAGVDSGEAQIRAAATDLADYTTRLGGLFDQLSTFMTAIGRLGPEVQKAIASGNKSQGQLDSPANEGARGRYPRGSVQGQINPLTGEVIRALDKLGKPLPEGTKVGGRYTTPGVGGEEARYGREMAAAISKVAAEGAAKGAQQAAQPVAIRDIPAAVINDASIERIATAMQENVTATQRVEAAVDKVAALLNKGLRIEAGDQAEIDAVAAPQAGTTKLTKDQNQALYAAYRETLESTRKDLGKEAFDALWTKLRNAEAGAQAKGLSIVPGGGAEGSVTDVLANTDDRLSAKQLDRLRDRLSQLTDEVQALESELSQLPEGSAELERKSNQLERLREQRMSAEQAFVQQESRAETAERQRRAAQRKAQQGAELRISEDQRKYREATRAQLELAANPALLQAQVGKGPGQMGKRELQALADTLTGQGYTTPYRAVRPDTGVTRSTVDELVAAISASGQEYIKSGRVTADDLTLRPTQRTSTVSEEVARLLNSTMTRFAAASADFTREFGGEGKFAIEGVRMTPEQAYTLLGANARSGGQDPRRLLDPRFISSGEFTTLDDSILGYRKPGRTKGRLQVGAEIGVENYDRLLAAGAQVEGFREQAARAARQDVLAELRRNPSFDPHSEDLFAGIEGKGDKANEARRGIGAMLTAVEEIQQFGEKLLADADRLAEAEENLKRTTSNILGYERALARGDELSEGRTASYHRAIARQPGQEATVEDLARRLDQRLSSMTDAEGRRPDFMLQPEFREPFAKRQQSIMLAEAYRENEIRPSIKQAEGARALRAAVFDYFGRAKIFGTDQGNTRDYFSRALPGVRTAGTRGREYFTLQDEQEFAGDPARQAQAQRALRRMTAGLSQYTRELDKLIRETAYGTLSEDELNEIRQKTAKGLSKLLSGYQAVRPEAQVPNPELFLPEQLFPREPLLSNRTGLQLTDRQGQPMYRSDIVQTGFDNNYLERAFNSWNPETGKFEDTLAATEIRRSNRSASAQEKRDQLEQDAKDAYNDPERSAEFAKQRAKALQAQITNLNGELKNLREDIKSYRAAIGVATKDLKKALGAKGWEELRQSEQALETLMEREARLWSQSSAARGPANTERGKARQAAAEAEMEENLRLQQALRARIQKQLTVSPAASEASEARLGALLGKDDSEAELARLTALRDRLQKQRRGVLGAPNADDLRDAQAEAEKSAEKVAKAESALATATARLEKVREELAAYENARRDDMAATTFEQPATLAGQQYTNEGEIHAAAEEIRNELKATLSALQDEERVAYAEGDTRKAEAAAAEQIPVRNQLSALESQLELAMRPIELADRGKGGPVATAPISPEERDRQERLRKLRPELDQGTEPVSPVSVDKAAQREYDRLRKDLTRYEEEVRDASNSLKRQQAIVDAANAALADLVETYNIVDSRRGSKATGPIEGVPGAVGGGGKGGGGDETAVAGAEPPDGGGVGILRQILAAIRQVNQTLKGGVKVSGKVVAAEGEGGSGASTKKSRPETYVPRSTPAGRSDFEESISETLPALGQLLRGQDDVAAATRLVADGVMSETAALNLFRDKLNQTAEQAEAFRKKVRGAVGDERLQSIANAVEDERQKQLANAPVQGPGNDAGRKEFEKEQRKAAEALRRQNLEERAAASQAAQHATAMTKLKDATKAEVAELERMSRAAKAGAVSQAELADQMAKVYGMVSQDLGSASAGRQATKGIYQSVGIQTTSEEIDEMARFAKSKGFKTVDSAMASGVIPGGVFGEQSAFTRALFGNHGFWSRVMASTGTFVVRNFTAGFVFGLTNALQQIIQQAILTESTFIRVSDALDQTGRDAGNLRTQLQSISSSYGVALNDVYETAAGLTGLFDSIDDIAGATKVVAELQAISMGALNAQEAMGALASITGAYGQELAGGTEGLQQVADTLTVLQNVIGTNVEVTAEGVGSLSGLAQQLNIDFEDTATYVAQIAKLTNQTGAAAGEQFGRILASFQTGRGRAALQEALPGSGINEAIQSGQYGEALRLLLKDWDNLSESQQRNLSVTIAGQRQARAFAALTNNSAKVLNAAAEAHNAEGQAQQRAEKIAATLNGQLQRLNANVTNLAQNLIRTGILDFFGLLLRGVNLVLSGVNKLFSMFNDVADSNPFLKLMKQISAGILGLIITLRLGTAAFAGFQASLAALKETAVVGAGLTAASEAAQNRPSIIAGTTGYLGGVADRADERATRQKFGIDQAQLQNNRAAVAVLNEQKKGTAEVTRAAKLQSAANNALAKSARGTATAIQGVATAGIGAQIAMVAVAAAIGVLYADIQRRQGITDSIEQQREALKNQDNGPAWNWSGSRYFGPNSEAAAQTMKDTEGLWNAVKFAGLVGPWDQLKDTVSHPIDTLKERGPLALTNPALNNLLDSALNGNESDMADRYKAWRGILDDHTVDVLNELDKTTDDAISQFDEGGRTDFVTTYTKGISDKLQSVARDVAGVAEPKVTYSVADAEALSADMNSKIDSARKDILDENNGMSDEQRQAALGELEKIATLNNERLTNVILTAKGLEAADKLSSDQMTRLDELRGLMSRARGSGAGVDEGLQTIAEDIGIPEDTKIGRLLAKQLDPTLGVVKAAKNDRKILEEEYQQALARYQAATSGDVEGLNPEDIDAYEQQLKQKIDELASAVEQNIQAFVASSQAIAAQAAGRGQYQRSFNALIQGIANIESQRDRGSENRQTTARYNAQEQDLATQAAQSRAAGMNVRLNAAKARSQSAQQSARIEEQIAQNEYFALRSAQSAAKIAGGEGPTIQSIRDAKNRWVQAQIALAVQAQQTNIARMSAQAAALWNGIDIAGAQEAIALKQYQYAVKNSGKHSAEAYAAYQGYVQSQHTTLSTMDQVAQAQNEATLASIPQGNAVAVAQQSVANAQAALAAASKYGTNSVEYQGALAQLYQAQQQAQQAQAAVAQAQAQLAVAYADARGDAVASAQASVGVAQAALDAALQASGGAQSADVLAAQAQLVAANAAVDQAQADLIQSKIAVSIALAESAGRTVRAARLQLKAAQEALKAALERSGGENTAEVNQARAAVVTAEAQARDAALQSQLDTINFNLEMNKITQSQAISALREILRTQDLTKQQRRDLLLQIKGMEEELSGSPWNFGDIKLPTPYLMKRRIAEIQRENGRRADAMAAGAIASSLGNGGGAGTIINDHSTQSFSFAGLSERQVRRIIEDALRNVRNTRTTGIRRGRR